MSPMRRRGSARRVESGNVFLENDALLEFKSGQITTIADGTLKLDGAGSRVADAGKLAATAR